MQRIFSRSGIINSSESLFMNYSRNNKKRFEWLIRNKKSSGNNDLLETYKLARDQDDFVTMNALTRNYPILEKIID